MDDEGTVKPAKIPIRETWESMEQLVDDGIARSIGVSNFQAQMLYDIMTYAKHPISALQVEHHPFLVQPELVQMANENGIAVTAYSSFGPQSFLELPPAFSKRAKDIPLLFDAEPVKAAAAKHGITPAQVLLRWSTQRYAHPSLSILVPKACYGHFFLPETGISPSSRSPMIPLAWHRISACWILI